MVAQATIPRLLEQHTTLDLRGIDRLYLNAYQPKLQAPGGVSISSSSIESIDLPRPP